VTVIGEALIDLVPGTEERTFLASPGGSPYNVAVGLARLGLATRLLARLADNAFGRILRERAAAEGVNLEFAPLASEPTTLAVVSLDAQAQASYDFYLNGTADWQWTAAETGRAPADSAILHFGSIASWTGPGDRHILDLASRMRSRGDVLVSYDPNVRPRLLSGPDSGRAAVERGVRLAHVAKASHEDVGWLYPARTAAEVAQLWLRLGAIAVIVTDGANGADVYMATGPALHRPAPAVTVADTVGAGDAFTAGLLASLSWHRLQSPVLLGRCQPGDLAGVVDDAIMVAALACQRPGADPPTLAEFTSSRSGRAGQPGC
jgi:fructokinase